MFIHKSILHRFTWFFYVLCGIALSKNSSGSLDSEALLKRGYMLLDDGEWEKARKYFSRSLDLDPENAQAYLGRLMSHLEVKHKEDLKNVAEPFDHSKNYANIMRFGDSGLKDELRGYNVHIKARNTENAYEDAIRLMKSAGTEDAYDKAEYAFKNLGDYKDSKELAEQCRAKAWDAKTKHAEESKKLGKKIGIITGIFVAAVVFIVLLVNVIMPQVKYKNAVSLVENGDYDKAIAEFRELGDYNDSKDKIFETEQRMKAQKYDDAAALMNVGNYEEAIDLLKNLSNYKNSKENLEECEYRILEDQLLGTWIFNSVDFGSRYDIYSSEEFYTIFPGIQFTLTFSKDRQYYFLTEIQGKTVYEVSSDYEILNESAIILHLNDGETTNCELEQNVIKINGNFLLDEKVTTFKLIFEKE